MEILLLALSAFVVGRFILNNDKKTSIIKEEDIEFGTVDEEGNDVDLNVSCSLGMSNLIDNRIVFTQGHLIVKNTSDEKCVCAYPEFYVANKVPVKGADNNFDEVVDNIIYKTVDGERKSFQGINMYYQNSAQQGFVNEKGEYVVKITSSKPKVPKELNPGDEWKIPINASINIDNNPNILLINNTPYYQFYFNVLMDYSVGDSPAYYTINSIVKATFNLPKRIEKNDKGEIIREYYGYN